MTLPHGFMFYFGFCVLFFLEEKTDAFFGRAECRLMSRVKEVGWRGRVHFRITFGWNSWW